MSEIVEEQAAYDKVEFLAMVKDAIEPPLRAAGFGTVQMHPHGAYLMTRFPSTCGLKAADGHLSIKATANEATSSVVLHKFATRLENAKALDVVRERYEEQLSEVLPVAVDTWTSGQGDATRAYAQSVLPGGGYKTGSPTVTAEWARSLALAWLQVLQADPIPDLATEVARRAATGPTP